MRKHITFTAVLMTVVAASSLLGQVKFGLGGVNIFGFFGGK